MGDTVDQEFLYAPIHDHLCSNSIVEVSHSLQRKAIVIEIPAGTSMTMIPAGISQLSFKKVPDLPGN